MIRLERAARYIPSRALSQPFEFVISLASVIGGLIGVIGVTSASSISSLLPAPIQYAWYAELMVGGALILFGLMRSNFRAELAGLQLYGPASLAYAIVILYVVGLPGLVSVLFYFHLAFACGLRAFTLLLVERTVKSARSMDSEL